MHSRLQGLLEAGEFVVCGEMSPPQGPERDVIRKKCAHFRGYVDAVNLTDNQTAVVRLSSVMSSVFALEGGVEPILQMTCRDRNRLAQQSDILGAAAAGVQNILCLTGDYMSFGNHPDAKGVFDLDSIQLIQMAAHMARGYFLCGDPIKSPLSLFVGGAANPFAEPMEMRILRLGKKIRAGAQFIQTQPVFDIPQFERWMQAVRDEGFHEQTAILAGVMPVRSVKALQYMNESVPGMRVANEYIQRMQEAKDPKQEGVAMCIEIMQQIRQIPGVRGLHIMPVMWESITPELVKGAGLYPRPALTDPISEGGQA